MMMIGIPGRRSTIYYYVVPASAIKINLALAGRNPGPPENDLPVTGRYKTVPA